MTVRVTCLASGSSGNSILFQHEHRAILVDAGLPARKLTTALLERGVVPGMVDAIFITHEHGDHIAGAEGLSRQFRAPVMCNQRTRDALRPVARDLAPEVFRTGECLRAGPFLVESYSVSHDAADPVGYLVTSGASRTAVMTDLGCVTADAVSAAAQSDLVILEANHDVTRLERGPYPWHLKRRILSDRGHLSNRQSAQLIAAALNSRPQSYWLAHLSRTNNTKTGARNAVVEYLADYGITVDVRVTDRDKPSLVWEAPRIEVQLGLFGAPAG